MPISPEQLSKIMNLCERVKDEPDHEKFDFLMVQLLEVFAETDRKKQSQVA